MLTNFLKIDHVLLRENKSLNNFHYTTLTKTYRSTICDVISHRGAYFYNSSIHRIFKMNGIIYYGFDN